MSVDVPELTVPDECVNESHTLGILYSVYLWLSVDSVLSPDVSEE